MAKKSVVVHRLLELEDMAVASIVSSVVDVRHLDTASLFVEWTGTAVGDFSIEARNVKPSNKNTVNDWYTLEFNDVPSAAGATGDFQMLLTELPFAEMRFRYDRTSSDGVLVKVDLVAKVKGA